ncbi:MAG: glucose-6-phosphate dehydrogenase [Chlorobiales bacterium]|nr:glucose-6-phosphate dehydrogenase [Chlorobiales bacterium]
MQEKPDNFSVVIFGANSDLASRKLFPSLFELAQWGHWPEEYRIIGVGRADLSHDEFRAQVFEKLITHSSGAFLDEPHFKAFSRRLFYVRLDLTDSEGYNDLYRELMYFSPDVGLAEHILFYLSTPPDLAPIIVKNLDHAGLGEKKDSRGGWRKIIVEKPYGTNLQTARELNVAIGEVFSEDRIFRIDHYLGKEPVQNIMVFRFSNGIFEPLWTRHYIANVEITIAEDFGIRDRGAFYEEAGLLRDIMQNHALQLLAAVAMEPPVDLSADSVRDEKAKLLRSIRPFLPSDAEESIVLGQYEGYRSEKNVAPNSTVETFAAVKFYVDNWRWKDVPFFIKAGKNLAETVTKIVITFKCPPQNYFGPAESCSYIANQVIFCIQPDETIALRFGAKRPGESVITDPVYMKFDYKTSFTEAGMTPYHRLLLDAINGDQMNFIRQDSVEYSWAIVDAIREAVKGTPPESYPIHSRGPESAVRIYS